ncbi:hypothetical protein IWQ60_010197 [Tieghemiomyces parasiticus]|uniref:Calcineurin-like phosphoesterase domain-containing protein n=1 Tax=Tieghemiomyces parasiticus TaxID=78921 RepID=A0A9W7ZKI7_9FUNG|nr:hypothetical protein IWQ60_010197 [Tieghemiomyces parasiticus]
MPVYRIAIVADPQITDQYSYGQTGLRLSLTNFITDQYARKNYWYLESLQQPDMVIILGDLFDGGRHWGDDQWYTELNRFRRIFRLPVGSVGTDRPLGSPSPAGADRGSTPPTFRYVAGNHDIGVSQSVILPALTRFQRVFGPVNYRLTVANHTLVILDDLSFGNTVLPELSRNTTRFLDEVATESDSTLRLLFTHIPLYRPDGTDCGPRRHNNTPINQESGFQYQNLVLEEDTATILTKLRPAVVFTGDDHDQCLIHHELPGPPPRRIPEYTVGSFSMAGGNMFPSYTLLTLTSGSQATFLSNSNATWATQLCELPSQVLIYITYALTLVLTLALLLWRTFVAVQYQSDGKLTDRYQLAAVEHIDPTLDTAGVRISVDPGTSYGRSPASPNCQPFREAKDDDHNTISSDDEASLSEEDPADYIYQHSRQIILRRAFLIQWGRAFGWALARVAVFPVIAFVACTLYFW